MAKFKVNEIVIVTNPESLYYNFIGQVTKYLDAANVVVYLAGIRNYIFREEELSLNEKKMLKKKPNKDDFLEQIYG